MAAVIQNPAKCEVRSVIRFLNAKGQNAADIHRELCAIYGPTVMSEGKVRQWCREFREGRSNVHDDERSGRPSVQTDDLVERVIQSSLLQPRPCPQRFLSFSSPEKVACIEAFQRQ